MEHIIKTRFAISEDLLSGLSNGYRAIIAKATNLDPKRRYQNALEMRLDLIANRSSYGLLSAGQVICPEEHSKGPLLNWSPLQARRPVWQLGVLGITVSALMVFAWAYAPSIKTRVEISHGNYQGLARLSENQFSAISFSVSAKGVSLSGKDLGCNNQSLDIGDKSVRCGSARYRVQFDNSSESQFSGYITKQGSAHIVEFRAQKELATQQNIRKG